MNLLFLHQNYPAQFGRLAKAFVEREGWTVVAVGHGERAPELTEWVRYYPYSKFVSPVETRYPPLEALGEDIRRGRAVLDTLTSLKRKGFRPDVVIAHPGWGETIFLRDVYPDARFIAYLEYFYRSAGSDIDFDPEFPPAASDLGYVRLRNIPSLLAFEAADVCLTPTNWQSGTYPLALRHALTTLHEGIDTVSARPDAAARLTLPSGQVLTRADEIVTYAARSLEPYRGFHVFMRALPDLLRRRPHATVLIVGGDGVSYGRAAPDGKRWREHLLAELGPVLDLSRIVFLGRLPYERYLSVLQVSTVHVYLTYPFVLSWSLLEAMSAGCAVVASATGPVTEVIKDGENGRLVDFFDKRALAGVIEGLLANASERWRLGEAARKTVVERYDFATKTYPRYREMVSVG